LPRFPKYQGSFERWRKNDPLGPEVQGADPDELQACLAVALAYVRYYWVETIEKEVWYLCESWLL